MGHVRAHVKANNSKLTQGPRHKKGFSHFFTLKASVFPKASLISVAPCCVAGLLTFLKLEANWQRYTTAVLTNNGVWSSFMSLLGFLIVFRTSQAYNRFWEGCSNVMTMKGEWFDACAALVAFCKSSKASQEAIWRFQNILIRLFSMLHAAALAEVDVDDHDGQDAFDFELIDALGIDARSIDAVRRSHVKVELIYTWIQQLVVENMEAGVLDIPAPILTRAFQELGSGKVALEQAMKIALVPFPFAYSQTCFCLLCLHWIFVPIVVSNWMTSTPWAILMTYMQVFTLWTLNFIAIELEEPFGMDWQDIDRRELQADFNRSVTILVTPQAMRTPSLSAEVSDDASSYSNADEHTRLLAGCADYLSFKHAIDGQRTCFKEIWRKSGALGSEKVVSWEDESSGLRLGGPIGKQEESEDRSLLSASSTASSPAPPGTSPSRSKLVAKASPSSGSFSIPSCSEDVDNGEAVGELDIENGHARPRQERSISDPKRRMKIRKKDTVAEGAIAQPGLSSQSALRPPLTPTPAPAPVQAVPPADARRRWEPSTPGGHGHEDGTRSERFRHLRGGQAAPSQHAQAATSAPATSGEQQPPITPGSPRTLH